MCADILRPSVLQSITTVWPGRPYPLGATWDGEGVNFALFSENAHKVELCLFDPKGRREIKRLILPEQTDRVWHCYLPEARPGLLYGYRVHGPYAPEQGHRFNSKKLLLDPYAKSIVGSLRWSDAHFGYRVGHRNEDLSRSDRDNAFGMPRCEVIDSAFTWGDDRLPRTPWHDTVIYEMHVKGFTELNPLVPPQLRGTYAGLATAPAIDYLKRLGVTAVELMPIHTFLNDHYLVEKKLKNYWGYNSIGFFAPDRRYSATDSIQEFKTMVKTLHSAGIEVILDVVYNHTAEGNHMGPTLCFRGIDNAAYYRLVPDDPRFYMDYTGCGNTLNMMHPRVLQLIMDSLRYWVTEMHVDGFRFDLASALARELHAVDQLGAFLDIIHQDPVLSQVKLIAEPWDLGEGGYQVGNFPVGWTEWNGKYRDTVRDYWRGEGGKIGELAFRLTGSSDLYEHSGRRPYASINFITAHDGFTLNDLVSYNDKHNKANGEDNRDGESHNRSWNCGVEGPTDDPEVLALRARQRRNFLATLFLSQGVPMLTMGDEVARTQGGNNNAYCQDNEISWMNWSLDDEHKDLLEFTQHLIRLRREHPMLRRRRFFQGRLIKGTEVKDIVWLTPDGQEMNDEEWNMSFARSLTMYLVGAALEERDERGRPLEDDDFLMLLNAHHEPLEFVTPDTRRELPWRLLFDTARDNALGQQVAPGESYTLEGRALALLIQPRRAAHPKPPSAARLMEEQRPSAASVKEVGQARTAAKAAAEPAETVEDMSGDLPAGAAGVPQELTRHEPEEQPPTPEPREPEGDLPEDLPPETLEAVDNPEDLPPEAEAAVGTVEPEAVAGGAGEPGLAAAAADEDDGTVRRRHEMPFGPQLLDDGRVRFRLWAPSAESVQLWCDSGAGEVTLALEPQGEGWYQVDAPQAHPGSRYGFIVDDQLRVPDPASRYNPADVHGPSQVVDPAAFPWRDGHWKGRPWEEAVIYELHVGTFTPQGTFAAAIERLDHLVELGVTALELLPVADFPGARGWGYDGVLLYAPDSRYGTPEDLKALVQAAHDKGLMVMLDVVYNHFGPEGNYLHAYAKDFFTERHHTPWGAGLNFDGDNSAPVREFFIHNALYWLEEFHFDGLRLDAVHAILDDSEPHFLEELARRVQEGPGRERAIHLVLENEDNNARLLARDEEGRPRHYRAQWNDDFHNALHVQLTGETDGYYKAFSDKPLWYAARALAEGFAFQGEASRFRDGEARGEPSSHLPPTAFVNFLQNHDQIGNRALGERLSALVEPRALRASLGLTLLAPAIPMLYMGEEFAADSPFLFFCDLGDELRQAVTEGRRREFAEFPPFADPEAREKIPDPVDPATFEASKLSWEQLNLARHAEVLRLYRQLLELRHREIVPLMPLAGPGTFKLFEPGGLRVDWPLDDGRRLVVAANLADKPLARPELPLGRTLYETDPDLAGTEQLPDWSLLWLLAEEVR